MTSTLRIRTRLDIERKYIRTYNKSFINGQGDKQFLTNMSNGRMKYHRRQWERNQEQYMASKYQTNTALSENYHANFRVSRFDSTEGFVVPPNYQFTITPYSYIYLNVQYGGTAPISVRAVPNVPTVVPYYGNSADIINVGSASAIRDFGDLSALYADTVSVQNATRVKTLKLGNSTPGYENARFSALTTGANGLLEELDITNITSFDTTLDLSKLLNLNSLYAFGTNIPSVIFAEGSKISYVELPAVNGIDLRNLKYLSTNNLKLSSYDNVVDLIVEGCPLIDQLSLLEACTKVNKVRLDNVNFGTKTYEYFENNIFKLSGFDDDKPNAQIAGTVHIENLDGAQFNELKKRYPNLIVTYDLLTSVITFKNTDLTTVIYEQTILNAGDCEDPITEAGKAAPVKTATQEFTYEWFGWADIPDTIVNYENVDSSELEAIEQADYAKYRVNCIKHVEGDRMLYPVFKAIRNAYEIRFVNLTIADETKQVLQVVDTLYGYDAMFTGDAPIKGDTKSPDNYAFTGWYPKPEKITGPMTCVAQFSFLDDRWYTLGVSDISDCVDSKGNVYDGYTLNSDGTMVITECNNKFNPAIKVPENLEISDASYSVVSLGGFADHSNLEFIKMPDTLTDIRSRAFYNCYNLESLEIPSNVSTIGSNAFQLCSKLKEIFIPAAVTKISAAAFAECNNLASIRVSEDNSNYVVIQDCLVNKQNKLLVQGLKTGVIPQDGSVTELGSYCFARTDIASIVIPDTITVVPNNAFSSCDYLTDVVLPDTVVTLDATCFAWCDNLKEITLPEGLKNIRTYVFNQCGFEEVVLPSTIENLLEKSFGDLSNLKTVTFKKRVDENGNIIVPFIHKHAFKGSGGDEEIIFNVPWSADYDYNYTESVRNADGTTSIVKVDPIGWGAENYTINYNWEETE